MKEGEGRSNVNADRHPDRETLQAFREHRLSGPDVVSVALHVGRCSACAAPHAADGEAALLALVSRNREEHLSDVELDLLVDERVDDPAYRLLSRHAAGCAMCRAELEDLRRFAADDEVVPFRAPHAPVVADFRRDRGTPWRWLAAAAAILIVLSITFVALRRGPATREIASAPNPAPSPQPQSIEKHDPAPLASLADDSGRVELRADGTLAGVAAASPADADSARAVLSGRALAIPAFITAMPGAVRGTTAEAAPIRALEPFRSAVRDARPRFAWTPVRNARSYRVAVYDADYEEIASSAPIPLTSWRPSKPLPTGADLTWQVVAETPDGELSSAGSDRAEAVFHVLSASETKELSRDEALYRDSHLLRGVLYSRLGLLHDAEREFRRLASLNPGSPIATKLVASVARRE
jgi:hypothetical protein